MKVVKIEGGRFRSSLRAVYIRRLSVIYSVSARNLFRVRSEYIPCLHAV